MVPEPPTVLEDLDWDVASLLVQDAIELGEDWTVTVGVRWDDVSNVGDRWTPRLAAVWRVSETDVLKAQYAEGYRAPSFFELYNGGVHNPNLDFETIRTAELGYVHRRTERVARVTLFRSEMEELIGGVEAAGPLAFGNPAEAEATGVELEWTEHLGERWKAIANLSWVDSESSRAGGPLDETFGRVTWLGNLGVLYRLRPELLLGLHWHHVGDRDGALDDEYDGYELVDLAVSWRSRRLEGLSVRGSLRNALDEETGAVFRMPHGVVRPVYSGRVATLQLAWEF
jgi:iron complex outermembrane receptor protein